MTRKTKKIIYNTVTITVMVLGFMYVCSRFIHLGNVEYTDNAQTKKHITPINTRVQGFIKEIRFDEFQEVHKGDTLIIIEDSEFKLRLAQAQADLENALAGQKATDAGIKTTSNNLSVSDAAIEGAKAEMENAKLEMVRFGKLLAKESVTQQQYDNVCTAYKAAKARYEQVYRAKHSTSLVRSEQSHRLGQNNAIIEVARATVELAKLNLSYTVITAPCDGMTGKKNIHEGQLVQPGQPMVDVVDNSQIWVIANYRETQLPRIKIGNSVKITVDGVPEEEYNGEVEAISDASGSAFSIIPEDNATGNFVKVEQRVPVKIRLKGNSKESIAKLRAGLNVECSIKY